jgi:hypothetical protein
MQRSDDGGKTWEPVGNEFKYDGVPGTHQWYDGRAIPRSCGCGVWRKGAAYPPEVRNNESPVAPGGEEYA